MNNPVKPRSVNLSAVLLECIIQLTLNQLISSRFYFVTTTRVCEVLRSWPLQLLLIFMRFVYWCICSRTVIKQWHWLTSREAMISFGCNPASKYLQTSYFILSFASESAYLGTQETLCVGKGYCEGSWSKAAWTDFTSILSLRVSERRFETLLRKFR
jgi:hypothetical protein